MKVCDDKVVTIHYTLKDADGELLDSSTPEDPMAYLHGQGNIIEGLETALVGKQVGEKLSVSVEPSEAYGEFDESMIQKVPVSAFEGVESVEPGMQFHADTADGPRVVTVKQVKDENVTVDANHPLAGIHLHFEVEITDIRNATEDELQHGHIHGPGCNH